MLQVAGLIPPAQQPTNVLAPLLVDKMEADMIKLRSKVSIPDAAFSDCMKLIQMYRDEPAPFSWDESQVKHFFGQSQASRPTKRLRTTRELPFKVCVGHYYIVNPSDDSPLPIWIAQVVRAELDPEGGFDVITVRYLSPEPLHRPTKQKDAKYVAPREEDVDFYFKVYYSIDQTEIPDEELENKLTADKLNAPISMRAVVKKRENNNYWYSYTRIMERDILLAKRWAERFADNLLDEEDDEVPFTRAQLEQPNQIARSNRPRPTASSSSSSSSSGSNEVLPAIGSFNRAQMLLGNSL